MHFNLPTNRNADILQIQCLYLIDCTYKLNEMKTKASCCSLDPSGLQACVPAAAEALSESPMSLNTLKPALFPI